ncbi:MAG: PTS system mannose/fructose/sorbose family transporter subunit IID [Coprobacillus cateniformis]|uniref:PTS system mannose/fructose/sorbose family transporter subunit IID n=1 Tax=Coprobacillus cateniformis TaxID=100884 RepID=UPI00321A2E08
MKYYGTVLGYEKGVEYINSGEQAKVMQKIINIATMVGVIVIGALIGSYVKVNIGTELKVNETVVSIQQLLDGIMPKLLPLLLTVTLYKVNTKMPRKYLIFLIFGLLIVGTILATLGVLA